MNFPFLPSFSDSFRPSLSRCFHSFHLFIVYGVAYFEVLLSQQDADGNELKLPFLTHADTHTHTDLLN